MIQYFIFIIEVSICLTLFYLIYILFVSGDTFHNLKRFYLLFVVVISTLIPQIPSNKITKEIGKTIVIYNPTTQTDYSNYRDTFEKVIFGNVPTNITSKNSSTSFRFILTLIYIIGLAYMLYKLLYNLLVIRKLISVNGKKKHEDYYIINLPDGYSSFTFFNYIFLNSNNLNTKDKEDVLLHELEHCKQKHSADIIFIEIIKIFLWFNPVIWLIKNSLVKTHECLADQSVINNKSENPVDYQSLLLKQYLSNTNIELAHPFNYSLIKYRIKMMTKNKSRWWAKYKLFIAIPIIIVGLVAFSNADLKLDNNSDNYGEKSELQPVGMVFIPQGSFVMKRSDGQTTKEINVSVGAFWMKESEVSIKEYYEYLESLKKDTSVSAYNEALPDLSKTPFENYFTSKKYQDYPIVGVTLIQARKFCNWKTNTENKTLTKQGKPNGRDYRIPLDTEWIYASFGGVLPEEIAKSEISSLTKTRSRKPNEWGLYNMSDNVSEWTANILNPRLRITRNSQEGKGTYVVQEKDILDSTSEWKTIDIEPRLLLNYMDSLNMQTGQTIVKGNSYRNIVIDGNQILESSISYDYVGFRYVRSYIGKQNN